MFWLQLVVEDFWDVYYCVGGIGEDVVVDREW